MEKKLFKVYGQCCTVPHRIIECSDDEFNDALQAIFECLFDNNIVHITDEMDEDASGWLMDKFYSEVMDKAMEIVYNMLDDGLYVHCGDYALIKAEDKYSVKIPSCCHFETIWFQKEMEKIMKKYA